MLKQSCLLDTLSNDMQENSPAEVTSVAPVADRPEQVTVDEVQMLSHSELIRRLEDLGIRVNPERTRHQLIYDLLKGYALREVKILADGILDCSVESVPFFRWPRFSFLNCPENILVPAHLVKKLALHS